MKFQPGQRVRFRSNVSDKYFTGEIVRELKDGFYLVNDGTGLTPRRVHSSRLGIIPIPSGQVFA